VSSSASPCPPVCVVVLHWNAPGETLRCLASLSDLRYPNHTVLVVDNGSTDGSAERVRRARPEVAFLATGRNLGYTGGNNAGIAHALEEGAEYVLLLNNDTELANPDFLYLMVKDMDLDRRAGIAGPLVMDPGGRTQGTILYDPTLARCLSESAALRLGRLRPADYARRQEVQAVSGVCFLVRRRVFEEVGLLDEEYFMYGEELDYCRRAREHGWNVVYQPIASVLHHHDPGGGTESQRRRKHLYSRRNLVLFLRKHQGRFPAALLAGAFLLSGAVRVARARLGGGDDLLGSPSLYRELIAEIGHVLRSRPTPGLHSRLGED
jgi:GT2 family glycosyltransferase